MNNSFTFVHVDEKVKLKKKYWVKDWTGISRCLKGTKIFHIICYFQKEYIEAPIYMDQMQLVGCRSNKLRSGYILDGQISMFLYEASSDIPRPKLIWQVSHWKSEKYRTRVRCYVHTLYKVLDYRCFNGFLFYSYNDFNGIVRWVLDMIFT